MPTFTTEPWIGHFTLFTEKINVPKFITHVVSCGFLIALRRSRKVAVCLYQGIPCTFKLSILHLSLLLIYMATFTYHKTDSYFFAILDELTRRQGWSEDQKYRDSFSSGRLQSQEKEKRRRGGWEKKRKKNNTILNTNKILERAFSWGGGGGGVLLLNPLSPSGDQHLISPYNVTTWLNIYSKSGE